MAFFAFMGVMHYTYFSSDFLQTLVAGPAAIAQDAAIEVPQDFERPEEPFEERLPMGYLKDLEWEKRLKSMTRLTVNQSVEYDDNIFNQSGNEKVSDLIFTTRAEVNVNLISVENPHLPNLLKEGGFNLGVTYLVIYDFFSRNRDLNEKDQIFAFDFQLPAIEIPIAEKRFGRKLELTVTENFHPEEFTNNLIKDRENRQLRFVNDFSAVLTYALNRKVSFSFPYVNRLIRYKDSRLKDSNSLSHTFSPTLSYVLTPKTSVFSGARFEMVQFQQGSSNHRTLTLDAGLFKEMTAKINVGFSGGYQVRIPNEETSLDQESNNLKTVFFDAFYNQRISRKTAVRIEARNEITDTLSRFENFSGARSIQEAVEQGNPSVIQTTWNAEMNHALTEKTALYARGNVVRDQQENLERGDFLYSLGMGLSYRLRHNISLNLDYRHTSRNSDVSEDDFKDNLFTLSLTYQIGGGDALIHIRRGGKAFVEE